MSQYLRTHLFRATSVFLILTLSACANVATQQPNQGEDLLFVSHADGDLDIYVTNTHTNVTSKLTDNDRDDMHPVWSADGSKIAYASSQHGLYEIYVMDPDGANKTRITENQGMDLNPQWAPDNQSLVYVSDRSGVEQLYHYSFETNEEVALTNSKEGAIGPKYSRDGKYVAYSERKGKKLLLKTVNTETGEVKLLVDDVSATAASWSPDSRKIAFSGRKKRRTNIYVVDVYDSSRQQLTDSRAIDAEPNWLPSGDAIIFITQPEYRTKAQVHRIDLNGDKTPQRLSSSESEEMHLSVSADGKQLSYVRFENRFYHTYVMDLHSREVRKIAGELTKTQLTPQFKPAG